MTDFVSLYAGHPNDISNEGRDKFDRVRVIKETNPIKPPGGLAKDYGVEVIAESKKDKFTYRIEVGAQKVNNLYNMYEDEFDMVISSDNGINGEYSNPKERNQKIIKILSRIVPIYINTDKAEKISE